MTFVLLIIPAIIVVYATGGNLKWLMMRPLRFKWLILVNFILQLLIFTGLPIIDSIPLQFIGIIHIVSYFLMLIFVGLNAKIPGVAIIGLGTLSNALVIAFNGGFMPSPLFPPHEVYLNVIGISIESRLLFLADVLSMPDWLNLPDAFSIGDVFIVVGMFMFLLINSRKPKPNKAI